VHSPANPNRRIRWRRIVGGSLLALAALYLLLLIPESPPPAVRLAGGQAFVWNRDAFWPELEAQFLRARAAGCDALTGSLDGSINEIRQMLDAIAATNLPPSAPVFDALETNFFQLAPFVAACPDRLPDLLQTYARMRSVVKQQSTHWPMAEHETHARLYRLLYGGRAAVEEAMLQAPRSRVPSLTAGDPEPSATPSATVQGVTLHSGDILVSRGGTAASALIARGNDFPGNFSHVALVHVDETSHAVSLIEAHIECGVVVSSGNAYLGDPKLRIMVLRLRADLPPVEADPQLPHRAATQALRAAATRHIAYDFAMDFRDHTRQFCSEVASAACEPLGVTLWMKLSRLSTPGVTAWLSALGVRQFETQEPADLEYDPQLRVVAEWRDPETLFKDHVDNAVIDVMLEEAERGRRLDYNHWKLPLARLAKAWSAVKNRFGGVGPVPEGMSATTALRVQLLKEQHAAIRARVRQRADAFQNEHGYTPPSWELIRLAREEQKELIP
jgi:hypothetical protein